ncbi:cupredoxin domain-containing protein [Sinorhizobium garamanticum]|uniref:Cupredoxin domain-containing protein n=1 Tax=Sinorhizobium garamanticum TaxID=680247 RepID=A0ABY8D6S4_9HYPH|nr:cupredoxin domain-containing protein [Sinorhizobium garamanticum]WEX86570.1 cupredoxin domain-containing protein [Sinorhizobium garamanticum]
MRAAILLGMAGTVLASASHAGEHRIGMAGMAYAPAMIEAKVGDTLVFVNDDTEAHNVLTATVGFSTDLGKQDPGSETSLTLRKSGAFDLECVIHEEMHARVVVRP